MGILLHKKCLDENRPPERIPLPGVCALHTSVSTFGFIPGVIKMRLNGVFVAQSGTLPCRRMAFGEALHRRHKDARDVDPHFKSHPSRLILLPIRYASLEAGFHFILQFAVRPRNVKIDQPKK